MEIGVNARYSPDGQLTELQYPGGLTRRDTLDASFTPVGRVYTRDADGQIVYSEQVVENTAGQWVTHNYTGGSKVYSYDRLGRLTRVQHEGAAIAGCVTRTYEYDGRTNRTRKSTFSPAADGTCRQDAADTVEGHTYDSADRMTDAGYVYDAYGRTTQLPSGLANIFYANDLVATQQLGDSRQSWTLDPKHRFRGYTTETNVDGSWVTASSKLNHYGDDSDEPRWTVEDTTQGTLTRNVSGPDGDLAATTSATGDVRLQLTSLHGDVAATIDIALTEPELYDYDEFGIPAQGQSQRRYGWLGGKQRSAEALGDVILMGVRLYSPALGRFLQVDPVDGGNATAYDYCSGDPVNCTDLDGRRGWLKKAWRFVKNNPALVASTIAMLTPPPVNVVAGAAAVVFSGISAYNNFRRGRWGAGVADVVGAIPGAGAAVRGYRAMRAASIAKRLAKGINKRKGYRGARIDKRQLLNKINRYRSAANRHWGHFKWWGKKDKTIAYPAVVGYTVCKYQSGCSRSRVSRWARLY